ncbi:hypothetical protein EDB84DRAFT_1523205 [Lactarius hengduanensis]|nr:hypothetical protein EDB84DRAFT_1523205 [Lactarius hengduanensis]
MVQWFMPSPPTLLGRAWVGPVGSILAQAIFLTGALITNPLMAPPTTPGFPARHTGPHSSTLPLPRKLTASHVHYSLPISLSALRTTPYQPLTETPTPTRTWQNRPDWNTPSSTTGNVTVHGTPGSLALA